MKIIDVPVFKEDGSVEALLKVGPEEAQKLLEFAVNFMVATGSIMLAKTAAGDTPLNGFNPDKFDA
jgi:hypothetical protein